MERADIAQRGLVRAGDLKRAGSVTDDKFKSTVMARRGGRLGSHCAIAGSDSCKGPLTFGTSASLNLLSTEEQDLCRQIRMNPRSYIAAKAIIIREYRKRGDEISRKQARDLLKCDVNKTGKIWDFLVRNGIIKPPAEPPASAVSASEGFSMRIDTNGIIPNG